MPKLTYAAMRSTLENNYGCKNMGSVLPPPYRSEMDMPDTYRSPDGDFFSLSQPEDDGGLHYHDFILPMLIEKYELVLINKAQVVNQE